MCGCSGVCIIPSYYSHTILYPYPYLPITDLYWRHHANILKSKYNGSLTCALFLKISIDFSIRDSTLPDKWLSNGFVKCLYEFVIDLLPSSVYNMFYTTDFLTKQRLGSYMILFSLSLSHTHTLVTWQKLAVINTWSITLL